MSDQNPTMRADKWLWHARFFKTRGLASKLISAGRLRVNAERIGKPSFGIGPQDVLTFPQARQIRVVKVLALSTRRGPAPEAQTLYEDMTPEPVKPPPAMRREPNKRPTKRDRRDIDRLRGVDPGE